MKNASIRDGGSKVKKNEEKIIIIGYGPFLCNGWKNGKRVHILK